VNDLPPELRAHGAAASGEDWLTALDREADQRLNRGETAIMDELTRQFEKTLILRALSHTGGRRIEAAHLLGVGRNTLTRKVQELKIDAGKDDERE
jgi:two-component system nitrogen regulation response regulator GlnG